MRGAEARGQSTARSLRNTFSNLKLSMPSIGGGLAGGAANLGGILNVAGGNILTSILGKVTGGMTDAIQVGVNYNKMLEAQSIAFQTLGQSAADTEKHLADLQALGLKAPFDYQDLVKASLTMNAFGFSMQSRIEDLRKLSDAAAIAAAGTGNFTEALQGIIFALGQMRAKGKVSAEEMNQLAERGIPAWDILSRKVGRTKEELQKLAETGKLRGDVAASLLTEGLGQFASGAGDRLSETILGKESNVRDAFQKRAAQDSKMLTEAYRNSLDAALKELEQGTGQSITAVVGDKLAGSLEFITEAITGIMQSPSGYFSDLMGALKLTGAQMWDSIQQGFTGAISSGGSAAVEAVTGWAGSLVDSAKKVLGIQSPSTVFAEIGQDVVDGFSKGIQDTIDRSSEGIRKWAKQIEEIGGESFLKAVEEMSKRLKIDPNKALNVMAFESGLNPAAKNPGGSATGLIQFLSSTAEALGTTVDKLKSMSAVEQLAYVEKYFQQFKKLADTQEALYTAVLAGRPVSDPEAALFTKGGKSTGRAYTANRGLDADRSGVITAGEATAKVLAQGFTTPITRSVAQFETAVDKFEAGVLRVDLATQNLTVRGGDGASQQPLGNLGSMTIRAEQALEPLAQIPETFKRLSMETTLAKRSLEVLPPPLAQVAQTAPQAASGMEAVTRASQEQIDALMATAGKFGTAASRFDEFKERMGQNFDDLIGSLFEGGDRWKDAAKNVAVDFFNSLASEMMLAATGGKYGSLGGLLGGLVGGLFGGLFGGKRAAGGPVMAGRTYLVGEQGPELFAPSSSGQIIPNGRMASSPVNITINVPVVAQGGNVTPQTRQQIAAQTAQALQAALARNA